MGMARVLVVDDSQLARRTLRRVLDRAGYVVIEVDSGQGAIERYATEKPDLVLLDLLMPGIDGFEVLKRLREIDSSAKIVVVSADIQSSSREMARDGGAAAFVEKPFEPKEILDAVKIALAGGQAWS